MAVQKRYFLRKGFGPKHFIQALPLPSGPFVFALPCLAAGALYELLKNIFQCTGPKSNICITNFSKMIV